LTETFDLGDSPKVDGAAVYVIKSGSHIAAIGSSGRLSGRLSDLANLNAHRASARILCLAYCTRKAPTVTILDRFSAGTRKKVYEDRERQRKSELGDPAKHIPGYDDCLGGKRLRDDLIKAVGNDSFEAGAIWTAFAIGEKLSLLFDERYRRAWEEIRFPPGPWIKRAEKLGWKLHI
jgi:hypothetical protein